MFLTKNDDNSRQLYNKAYKLKNACMYKIKHTLTLMFGFKAYFCLHCGPSIIVTYHTGDLQLCSAFISKLW